MKIWHIPPKYLDDDTLLSERELIERIFGNEHFHDSFVHSAIERKYLYNQQFLFIRHEMVVDELANRNHEFVSITEQMLDELPDDEEEFDISEMMIATDVELITSIWQEYIEFDDTLGSRLEQLMLQTTEQLLQELNYSISEYVEKYEL